MARVIPDRDLVHISRKKQSFPIHPMLREYLDQYDRSKGFKLDYSELEDRAEKIPVYDKRGRETLWFTMLYPPSYRAELDEKLRTVYAHLSTAGDTRVMKHLYIDRIDFCEFGNSQPFRIRVVNRYNDNQDYFYVKRADSSRVFGLELEHILSPNRINILVYGETLIEEHIAGIPGDLFIEEQLDPLIETDDETDGEAANGAALASQQPAGHQVAGEGGGTDAGSPKPAAKHAPKVTDPHPGVNAINPIRVCKEFVKFNERCFTKLLGDMRSYNYVVVVTQDFDDRQYRVRAIDFDRQSHEPNLKYYMPQFYKENQTVVGLVWKHLSPETIRQYQKEERSLIARRAEDDEGRLSDLFSAMAASSIAPRENTLSLANDIARYHHRPQLASIDHMGVLTREHLLYCIDT